MLIDEHFVDVLPRARPERLLTEAERLARGTILRSVFAENGAFSAICGIVLRCARKLSSFGGSFTSSTLPNALDVAPGTE